MIISKYLNSRQVKGLIKVSAIILPGDHDLPALNQSGFHSHIDRILDHMYEEDRNGIRSLLSCFAFLPSIAIALLIKVSEKNKKLPWILGSIFRQINIGIKGPLFTLYYSGIDCPSGQGEKIYQVLNYSVNVKQRPEDLADIHTSRENHINYHNPSPDDVQLIYQKAKQGHKDLKHYPIRQRVRYITELKSVILQRQEEIINTIQKDTKKSRSDALMSEIFGILDHLTYLEKFAYKVLKPRKVYTPLALMGKPSAVCFESLGTSLIISPWNYPFYQAIVPITSSFICGNATLYKPSEFTPLKGLVENILESAGFKKNWVQIVYGDGQTGQALIEAGPQKIFFTGSLATGSKIMEQAAKQIIPVELELGGKDPMIVFEDAHIKRAAAGAAWGAFTNTGQSCTSVERLYIQENIYDKFVKVLTDEIQNIIQEIDINGNADIGWMTTMDQVKIISRLLSDAKAKGAIQLTGLDWDGQSPQIPPILLEGCKQNMDLMREEIFGPLLPIFSFVDEEEALALANHSEYGLSASVWTANKNRAKRVCQHLETGNVSINNVMLTEGNHALPFGGIKKSGIGRYKGEFGLYGFSNIKSILYDTNSKKIEANWYPYTSNKYQVFSKMTSALFNNGLKNFLRFAFFGLKLERLSQKKKRGH